MWDDIKDRVGKNAAACLYCLLLSDDECNVQHVFMEEMEREL